MPQQPTITLNDGSVIPQIGLGVWQVPQDITAAVCIEANKAGYRAIDTAEGYQNEEGVGRAIRDGGVARKELFITSKLHNEAHARDAALRAFDETMRKLAIERIDLFLETTQIKGITLRFSAGNIFHPEEFRERTFYQSNLLNPAAPPRSTGLVLRTEERKQKGGPEGTQVFSIRASGTF